MASKPDQLPGWVVSSDESVWLETERARRMTPAQRWQEVMEVCGILAFYWKLPGYPERVRNAEEPLPESTQQTLARLREELRRSQR